MPIIAPIRQQVSMQLNNPVPISSSEDARITGASIASAGAGLANLGSAVSDVLDRSEKAKQLIDQQVIKGELDRRSMDIYADTINNDPSPDGSTLLTDFDARYAKMVNEYAAETKNPIIKGIATTVGNERREALLKLRLEKTAKYASRASENILANGIAYIEQFPDQHDQKVMEIRKGLGEIGAVVGFSEPIKVDAATSREAAMAAIRGYVHQGKYGVARSQLAMKHAGNMNSEDVAKMRDFIDEREHTERSRWLREVEVLEKTQKKSLEQARIDTFSGLMKKAQLSTTFEQRERLRTDAEALHRSTVLSDAQLRNFFHALDGRETKDKQSTVYDIKRRIRNGEPSARLFKEIDALVDSGTMSPATGATVYDLIKQRSSRSGAVGYKTEVAKYQKRIEALITPGVNIKYMTPTQKAYQFQVMDKFDEHLKNNPPNKAYVLTINEFVPEVLRAEFAPGIDATLQSSIPGIARATQQIYRETKLGKRSEKDAVGLLKILQMRKRLIEAQRAVNPAFDKKEQKK